MTARVYSLQLALDARDEAIELVKLNSEEWRPIAYEAVLHVARQRAKLEDPRFTTDSVWFVLYNLWKVPAPSEPKALGPVMQRAQRDRICVDTREWRKSTRPECHGREIPVYRSLVRP